MGSYLIKAEITLFTVIRQLPLLDAVPHEKRTGAVGKGENSLPVRQGAYGRWCRQIARAAGIPDTRLEHGRVSSRPTEADQAGATLEAIQGAHDAESTP
jgi:hypothetical protein